MVVVIEERLQPFIENGVHFFIVKDDGVGLHAVAAAIGDDSGKIIARHAVIA